MNTYLAGGPTTGLVVCNPANSGVVMDLHQVNNDVPCMTQVEPAEVFLEPPVARLLPGEWFAVPFEAIGWEEYPAW